MFARLMVLLGSMLVFAGCSESVGVSTMAVTRLQDVPAEKLEALSSRSYFFGHQSVGRNMLDGLRMVMADNPSIKLNVVESESVDNLAPGAFLHANVGKNRFPQTKIDQYQGALDAGLGNQVNVAFLKFCYVDLAQTGDAAALFEQYQASIERLKKAYPETTFVHFTLPVKSVPTGLKTTIKNLLGREIAEQEDNIRRAQYNRLLRETYDGKDPIFDIAKLESIDPATGAAFSFRLAGESYEAMSPGNTDDGGHLSESGKRWIAEQLVVFLANLE